MMKKRYRLRIISSREALDADREARQLGGGPLCRNACVLARALQHRGRPAFPSGAAVLEKLPPQTVACWMGAYDRLCRAECGDWQEQKRLLAADEMGRLRWKALRALKVLPRDPGELTDGDLLHCVLQMILDGEEQLERLCPSCRRDILQDGCPVCGAVQFGENPRFDPKRFEELKTHGSFGMAHGPAGDGAGEAAGV